MSRREGKFLQSLITIQEGVTVDAVGKEIRHHVWIGFEN